jgi:hypothetical protein
VKSQKNQIPYPNFCLSGYIDDVPDSHITTNRRR